ncbi:hypothetical protein C0Z22_01660 [Halobacteriovorax sp. DA5]|nr:hypothetical protein C0Z22_01660 [Halobacteriovorax sp. DA5]
MIETRRQVNKPNSSFRKELLNSNIHYCHIDFDGDCIYVNDLYLGYGLTVGTNLFQYTPDEKKGFFLEQVERVKNGEACHFFSESINLLGERDQWEIWLQPGYSATGTSPSFIEVYSRNINAGAENFISTLFKNFYTATDDDLFILNNQLVILDINKVTKQSLVGNKFSEVIFDDEEYLFFLNTFEQAKRLDGVALKVTHPIYRKRRSKKRFCRISVTYIVIQGVGRYMVQIRDVHQEHINRVTLKMQEKQFEEFERWRSLGQMSAGIAHEINNPLCIIRIQAEQLKDRYAGKIKDSDPSYMKKLESIIKQVDRIENIANSLKIYSRSSNSITKEIHNLDNLIQDSLGLFQAQTGREIYIDFKNPFSDLEVACKKNEFYQIILNLLTNSYQAVHQFESLEKCWIKIWVEESMLDQFTIYVQDGGDGIKDNVAKDIFTPFFTTKDVGEGTGLGLSISKKLALENNMILDFEKDFEYTTFSISLGQNIVRPSVDA